MTDVADFSGVSAGATQVVANASAACTADPPPATTFSVSIPVTGIPSTTRSILVLLEQTNSPGAGIGLQKVSITGDTTNRNYAPSKSVALGSGYTNFGAGTVYNPAYIPFYGALDSAGHLQVVANGAVDFSYQVLALPDADILGNDAVPVAVGNFYQPGAVAPTPLKVSQGSGDTFTVAPASAAVFQVEQTTPANLQAEVTPAPGTTFPTNRGRTGTVSAFRNFTSTASAQLVGPPAAGKVRIVDYVFSTASGSLSWGINNTATTLGNFPATSLVTPGWMIDPSQAGIYVGSSVTGGAVYIGYHDESA